MELYAQTRSSWRPRRISSREDPNSKFLEPYVHWLLAVIPETVPQWVSVQSYSKSQMHCVHITSLLIHLCQVATFMKLTMHDYIQIAGTSTGWNISSTYQQLIHQTNLNRKQMLIYNWIETIVHAVLGLWTLPTALDKGGKKLIKSPQLMFHWNKEVEPK